VFVGAYQLTGAPQGAVVTVARDALRAHLAAWSEQPHVLVGEIGAELGLVGMHRADGTDLPHAEFTARLAAARPLDRATALPEYVRDAGAILPSLPPSPFRE
jgi:hypothetical protein